MDLGDRSERELWCRAQVRLVVLAFGDTITAILLRSVHTRSGPLAMRPRGQYYVIFGHSALSRSTPSAVVQLEPPYIRMPYVS